MTDSNLHCDNVADLPVWRCITHLFISWSWTMYLITTTLLISWPFIYCILHPCCGSSHSYISHYWFTMAWGTAQSYVIHTHRTCWRLTDWKLAGMACSVLCFIVTTIFDSLMVCITMGPKLLKVAQKTLLWPADFVLCTQHQHTMLMALTFRVDLTHTCSMPLLEG